MMGVKRASADTREDDGSDGSNESIRLRDRSTFDRPTYDRPPYDRPTYDRPTSDRPPSGRRLSTRPRYPEMMQQPTQGSLEPARGSFVHRWRQSSSSDLNLGSPPLTPGTVTPMSLVTPSATWLPENRNSSLSASPAQFATPLVCYHSTLHVE
jgi:hypothetical protein